MYILYIGVIVFNVALAFTKKQSKFVYIVSIGLLIILMAGKSEGPDMNSYLTMYNGAKEGVNLFGEIGYFGLEYLFGHVLRCNFYLFRAFITIVGYTFMFKGISFFSVNYHWIIAMYMGYLFIIDTIQLRNFIAMAIFIFAFHFFISENWKDWIKYIVLIIIAATFQTTLLFTLSFLIYKCKNKKIMNRFILAFAILSFWSSISNDGENALFSFIIYNLLGGRGGSYYATRTGNSYLGIIALYCIDICILLYIEGFKKKYMDKDMQRYHDYIWRIHCLLVVFFPLLLRNVSFYRLIRNICVLKYIDYANAIDSFKGTSIYRIPLVLAVIVSVFLWGFVDYTLLNAYEYMVVPVLENNYFFGIDKEPSIIKFFFMHE